MDHYAKTAADLSAQTCADPVPLSFELEARRLHIWDWQMVPIHMPGLNRAAHAFDLEGLQFMVFDQGYHRHRAPIAHCIEVNG